MATRMRLPAKPASLDLKHRNIGESSVTDSAWTNFCSLHPAATQEGRTQTFYVKEIKASFCRAYYCRSKTYFPNHSFRAKSVVSDIYLDPVLQLRFVVIEREGIVVTVSSATLPRGKAARPWRKPYGPKTRPPGPIPDWILERDRHHERQRLDEIQQRLAAIRDKKARKLAAAVA